MSELKITHSVLRVGSFFLRNSAKRFSAYALAKELDSPYNAVWEVLNRLEDAGWLKSEMERVNPSVTPRPARRLYRLTPDGETKTRGLLKDLSV